MNLRNGLMRALWCCAPLLVAGLISPARLLADDFFQPPRTTQQPQSQQPQQPANQRIAPYGTSQGGAALQQPLPQGTSPYPGDSYQGLKPSSQSTTPNHGRTEFSSSGESFSQPRETDYQREANPQQRDAVRTARVEDQQSSPDHQTAPNAEVSPIAAKSESRPIGSAQKTSEEAAGTATENKLSLASPAKLFTAVMFVVFLILLTAKFWKKHIPGASIPIPAESMTVLGERKLNKNHSICLVRLGSRVLVLGASADGLRTLSEITDPVEIDFLSGMARSTQPDSVFTSALGSFMKKSGAAAGLSAKSSTTSARTGARSTEVPHV
ncbi:MAG: hypothetical protein CMJ46_15910 [Planctomyces sp.]|nr:hypothetical protein [Planctomyces sp.]